MRINRIRTNGIIALHAKGRGTVLTIFRDEGISGARGASNAPGLDTLLKGESRKWGIVRHAGCVREVERAMIRDRVMAAWIARGRL